MPGRCHTPFSIASSSSGSAGAKNSTGKVKARLSKPSTPIATMAADMMSMPNRFTAEPANTLALVGDGDMTAGLPSLPTRHIFLDTTSLFMLRGFVSLT